VVAAQNCENPLIPLVSISIYGAENDSYSATLWAVIEEVHHGDTEHTEGGVTKYDDE